MKNEKQRLIQAIENINQEKKQIQNSKEYRLGNTIIQTIGYLKKFQFSKIFKKITIRHREKIDRKKLHTKQIKEELTKSDEIEKSVEDKKIVVYTCIAGKYDEVLEPLYHNDNVDYIIYTNNENIQVKEWQKRDIPDEIQKLNSNVLINRYIKMHPKELFEDYDYSIYIDGNIRTVSDLSSFVNKVNSKTGLALHRHSTRSCVYQEAKACELYKKGNSDKLDYQLEQYRKDGFSDNFGLLECNVIVSDLKNEVSAGILNDWWDDFIKWSSMRDQISFPYVLWKKGFKIDDVGSLGENVFNNPKIEIIKHS